MILHARGYDVLLKPHVDVEDETWRGAIAPADVGCWFSAYGSFINHYAALAQRAGVELFAVGTELSSLQGTAQRARWESMVAAVRSRFAGPLTYAANWGEYRDASFWDLVDLAGVNAYFPLSETRNPSVQDLTRGWTEYSGTLGTHNWIAELEAWHATIGKPVIFTEIGYRSVDSAGQRPWDANGMGPYNAGLQARAYQARRVQKLDRVWLRAVS